MASNMPQPTLDLRQDQMDQVRAAAHAHCIACGGWIGHSPRLRFVVTAQNTVEASFQPSIAYQSYDGIMHGGIAALLLDAAMTNCLFALGVCGVTGELNLRFKEPVSPQRACVLRAWIERAFPPLFVLRSELAQDGLVRIWAVGKFMNRAIADPAGGRI